MMDRHSLASLAIVVQQPLTRLLTGARLCAGPRWGSVVAWIPRVAGAATIWGHARMRTLSRHTGGEFEAGQLFPLGATVVRPIVKWW